MCDLDDTDEVTDSNRVRARKEHRCDACGETIQRTHFYMRSGSLHDGSWTTWRHCLRCWAIIKAIWARGEAAQWDLGCGVEWSEAFDAPPPDHIARLAFLTQSDAQRELAK